MMTERNAKTATPVLLTLLNLFGFLSAAAMATDGLGEMSFPLWQVGLTLVAWLIGLLWMVQQAFMPELGVQVGRAGRAALFGAALLPAPDAPRTRPVQRPAEVRPAVDPPVLCVSGELDAEGCIQYDLALRRGDRVTITVCATGERSTLDPVVTLLDADGYRLAYNDDHDSADPALNTLDARIADLRIRRDDTYTIAVETYAGFGPFDLRVDVWRQG